MGLIRLLILAAATTTITNASQSIFVEQKTIWNTKEMLHVVIDLEFTSYITACKQLKATLSQFRSEDDKHIHAWNAKDLLQSRIDTECQLADHWTSHSRVTRQIAGIAMGVFSSIFSIVNAVRISALSAKVDKAAATERHELLQLQHQQTMMNKMQQQLSIVAQKSADTQRYIESIRRSYERNMFFIDMNLRTDIIAGYSQTIRDVWTDLNNGRLNLDILQLEQFKTIESNIRDAANKMGGTLPYQSLEELIQSLLAFMQKDRVGKFFFISQSSKKNYGCISFYQHQSLCSTTMTPTMSLSRLRPTSSSSRRTT
jgi:hypothetical protein